MDASQVRFLVFDVESVADGALVSRIRYPGVNLPPDVAIQRYRDELLAKYESDFIPYTFQVPVSVAIAKLSADFRLIDLVVLDEPHYRPHIITEKFWRGWEVYKRPTFVSFNGRTFDIPLMELAAFRFGIGLASWFDLNAKQYQQKRYRYNVESHLDLHDILTNFGAVRFTGGLNLAANLIGKPGKMEVQGHMVQDMYNAGNLAEINDYCRCDVLDTYFVFLRTAVMLGQLALEAEQQLVAETKAWIETKAESSPAYRTYLANWGDWATPWEGSDK